MQGIISAAMCLQLSRLGLKNTLDAVYGASAGAINGAYFIAGQVRGWRLILLALLQQTVQHSMATPGGALLQE